MSKKHKRHILNSPKSAATRRKERQKRDDEKLRKQIIQWLVLPQLVRMRYMPVLYCDTGIG